MINHTMIVSFVQSIPDAELDQYLKDIEKMMVDTGQVQSFATQRHIPVPGEGVGPAVVATAIVQIGLADREALHAVFAAPGAEEIIRRWQARFPYKVAWANHALLA